MLTSKSLVSEENSEVQRQGRYAKKITIKQSRQKSLAFFKHITL